MKFILMMSVGIIAAIGAILIISLANPLGIARATEFLTERGYSVVFGDFANGNATVIVCASNVVNTEGCDFISDGTDDGADFALAVASLTAGRTSIETVKGVGDFTWATGAENLPDYTRIDGYEASFTKVEDGTQAFFRNADRDSTGNTHIEILGGIYDGNKTAGATVVGNARGLLFIRVDNLRIQDVEIGNMRSDCIRVEGTELGGTGTTRPYFINNVYVHDCLQHGLRLMRSARNTHVSDVVSQLNDIGMSIDHSEGNYSNIALKDSTTYGLRVHNGHTLSLADLLIQGSGEHGAMLWGLVDSTIANWLVKDSSQNVTDGADYNTGLQWDLSGSGTNEYYAVVVTTLVDPGLLVPFNVRDDGVAMTPGTIGSLAVNEFAFGDNDSNGFDAIYARLSDNTDPDASTMTAFGYSDIFWSNSDDESYGVNKDIAGSNIRAGPRGTTDIAYSMYFEGNSEFNSQSPGNATADSNDNIILSPVFTKDGISGDIKAPDAIGTLRMLHAVEDGEHLTLYGREASGTGTITTTSLTVTHGLLETPVDGECWFIATENPTTDVGTLWVDTYTSTQFNLNVKVDPGASDLDVAWFCETR